MKKIEQIIHIITRYKTLHYSQNKAEKELIRLLKFLSEEEKKLLKPQMLRKYNRERFDVEGGRERYSLAQIAGFTIFYISYLIYFCCWILIFENYERVLDQGIEICSKPEERKQFCLEQFKHLEIEIYSKPEERKQ